MRILWKASLTIIMATLILLTLTYELSSSIMQQTYRKLDDQEIRFRFDRILTLVDQEENELSAFVKNWGPWDETYNFMENRNPNYAENNLMNTTFLSKRLNFVALLDNNKLPVLVKLFDLESSQFLTNRPFQMDLVTCLAESPLLRQVVMDAQSGILVCGDGPVFVASYPILTSSFEGPDRGTIVAGRFFNKYEAQYIDSLTNFPLKVWWGANVPITAASLLSGAMTVQPLNETMVAGYMMLNDVYGNPNVVLETDISGGSYGQGGYVLSQFLWITLIEGVVVTGVTVLILQNQVLGRTTRLSRDLGKVGKSGSFSTRVPIDNHKDELTKLAGDINSMLDTIQSNQAKLAQNERLAAIGQLALMVGHDLRNPLQSLTFATHSLKNGAQSIEDHAELIRIIEDSINYADGIVRDLSEYAKDLKLNLQDTGINSIIQATLTSSHIPGSIHVKLPETDYIVTADSTAMQRVLTNLVRNACDAMPQGGDLTIHTSRSDGFLRIGVSDTGTGIPKEVIQNLGKPLQTTKAKGMGLGLAISKRIVEAHGGLITAESVDGKGSKFTITLHAKDPEGGGISNA